MSAAGDREGELHPGSGRCVCLGLRWWRGGERAVVAEEGPQDVDASAGEGDDGGDVLVALGSFLEVVGAVGAVADDAGLGGEVEDAA